MSSKLQRTCPINGCKVAIRNSLLMCPEHWGMCPKSLRSAVWRWYRPGQEKNGMASPMYVEAARAAIAAVNENEKVVAETARQQILL